MYRQSLRAARQATRGTRSLRQLTPAARAYSTGTGSGSGPSGAGRTNLKNLAIGGAAVGLGAALIAGYTRSRPVQLDGVPNVEVIETYGAPWTPVHALEQDDPRVSKALQNRR